MVLHRRAWPIPGEVVQGILVGVRRYAGVVACARPSFSSDAPRVRVLIDGGFLPSDRPEIPSFFLWRRAGGRGRPGGETRGTVWNNRCRYIYTSFPASHT